VKRKSYVYALYAGAAPRPFYIGVGTHGARNPRERHHLYEARGRSGGKNNLKLQFIREFIAGGVEYRDCIIAAELTREEAYALEVKLIDVFGREALGGCLYNLSAGGYGGRNPLPSTREKMRAASSQRMSKEAERKKISEATKCAMKRPEVAENFRQGVERRVLTEDGRKRLSEANKNRIVLDETRKKCAEVTKARNAANPESFQAFLSFANRNGFNGRHTSAAKEKIREASRAQWSDPEIREKRIRGMINAQNRPELKRHLSEMKRGRKPMLGKTHSEETREKMRQAHARRKNRSNNSD
jgi:hypothetical protein